MKKILATLFFLLPAVAQAQIVGTLPFQLQNGTTADATQVMADFNKILNDINANAAKNGINTDITALISLATPITPVQGGTTVYFASTSAGTANAQTVASPAPVGFTLTIGKRVVFLAGFTNTGSMTLNVNATGATNVFRYTPAGPIALTGGEVVAGNYIEAIYDGTRYLLYTNAATPAYGPETALVSATTTDLGTVSSHNVQITGTTTITSFGSSAVTTYPIYRIRFAGVLTLTHSGTLFLPGSANIVTAANDTAVAEYFGGGGWNVISYDKANGAAVATAVPTRQIFLSGSGTYTTPANARWIRIRLVGAGSGGGGGNTSTTAAAGGTSTFSGGSLSAGGGQGGASATSQAISGGVASGGNILNVNGGSGQGPGGTTSLMGGQGGASCLGGNGAGGAAGSGSATAGAANSGGGGGGGGAGASGGSAAGGAAGGCVEHVITSPAASYTYVIGAGSAGIAGTSAGNGAAGAAGQMVVEEYY